MSAWEAYTTGALQIATVVSLLYTKIVPFNNTSNIFVIYWNCYFLFKFTIQAEFFWQWYCTHTKLSKTYLWICRFSSNRFLRFTFTFSFFGFWWGCRHGRELIFNTSNFDLDANVKTEVVNAKIKTSYYLIEKFLQVAKIAIVRKFNGRNCWVSGAVKEFICCVKWKFLLKTISTRLQEKNVISQIAIFASLMMALI